MRDQWFSTGLALVVTVLGIVAVGGSGEGDSNGPDMAVVDALEREGVLAGTACPGRGCSNEPLPRWVMAVWVSRATGLVPEPPEARSRFSDVASRGWWAPHIEQLAELGIVLGCGTSPARFCPNDAVTKGQMATTLARAFGLPPASPSPFVDIDHSAHATAIDALDAAGIGTGCGQQPPRFCPDQAVTRNEGAALLHQVMLWYQPADSGPGWVSHDLPADEMPQALGGTPTTLRSLLDGRRPMLLWFLAPW